MSDPAATWQVVLAHLQAGRMDEAAAACRALHAAAPDDPTTLHLLGMVELASGNALDAIAHLGRAAALQPDVLRIQLALADALLAARRYPEAAERYRRVTTLGPDCADAWHRLGQTLAVLGDIDAAVEALRRAAQIAPGHVGVQRDLAAAGSAGDPDAMAAALQRPGQHAAAQDATQRIAAGIALATALDQAGRYAEAFHHLEAANALLRSAAPPFEAAALRSYIDERIAICTPDWFAHYAGVGNPSEQPVFVVGMPRSGTTLVEQILASHPRVAAIGEGHLIGAIGDALRQEQPEQADGVWDAALCTRLANAHVARLRVLGGGASRVVDKTPDNLFHLGLIAALFPGARVIACRRDPRDVCLSCYFQTFEHPMPYANDLGACAERWQQCDRLLAHWRHVLPLPLHVVQYEALVANLEGEARWLIDFLGLDWDPACLTFHQTRREVRSASVWQVRRPLYANSVGRWRHYAPFLTPLLDAFGRD